MYGTKTLAYTGPGLAIGGYVLDQATLIGVAAVMIVAGAMMVRFTFRKNKSVADL